MNLQRGFTLLELMISLTLGLVLVAACVQVYVDSRQAYGFASEFARLQENGRYLQYQLGKDLRNLGNIGCPSDALVNANTTGQVSIDYVSNLNAIDHSENWFNGFHRGVEGVSTSADFLDGQSVRQDSDAFAIHLLELDSPVFVDSHTVTGSVPQFALQNDRLFENGTPVGVVGRDCANLALFVASGGDARSINYTTSSAGGPLENCNTGLAGSTVNCSPALPVAKVMSRNSQIYPLISAVYFVNDNNELMRWRVAEEEPRALVNGVEHVVMSYGIDSDGDGVANRYASGNELNGDQYLQVVSVNLSVALKSQQQLLDDPLSLDCGNRTSAMDRHLRKCINLAVNLRNRGRAL